MASYLERYRNGEYEAVWAELTALGDAVRDEDVYADAVAVADETMSRARLNVETLVSRLTSLGYNFVHPEQTFVLPGPWIEEQVAQLEAITGPLPLSLRAWYEQVCGVDFCGSHRRLGLWTSPLRGKTREWEWGEVIYADPLVVFPIEAVLMQFGAETTTNDPQDGEQHYIVIAPDDVYKANISGGAPYEIKVPDLAADGPLLNEWHHTTFVNYLRNSFKWGGFPGFERYNARPNEELTFLSEGLLPI